MFTSWVSKCQPLGNSGRIGRSIMRAVSVPFSPGRPSRLKNDPGIFPDAYMRSSPSTVKERKSPSRRLPATAVQRPIVSPCLTTTAPEACFAILPVSNEISLPEISTETRVTPSLLIFTAFLSRPSVGGLFSFSYSEPEELSGPRAADARLRELWTSICSRAGAGASGCAAGAVEGALDAFAQQLQRRQLAGRARLEAPAHDAVGVDEDERALGKAARVQHAEGRTRHALRLEVRELLDRDAELLLERFLRPSRVARNAVQRHATLGEVRERALIQLQLVGAHRAERERVEDEDRPLALQILLGERPVLAGQLEGKKWGAGSDDGHQSTTKGRGPSAARTQGAKCALHTSDRGRSCAPV